MESLKRADTVVPAAEPVASAVARFPAAGKTDAEILDEFYLRAYARRPRPAERERIEGYLASERSAGRSRKRGLENALWAILNSKEFQLNR